MPAGETMDQWPEVLKSSRYYTISNMVAQYWSFGMVSSLTAGGILKKPMTYSSKLSCVSWAHAVDEYSVSFATNKLTLCIL